MDTSHRGGLAVFNIILMEFLLYYTVTLEVIQSSGDSKGQRLHLNLHALVPE